jgi:hypothetical protein
MTKQIEPRTGLALLREPFPAHQISKLPKPTKKQTDDVRADFKQGIRCTLCGQWHHKDVVHLDYVGHAALTDRLLDCDATWNWEPVSVNQAGTPATDSNGGMWIKLTVCGVTRLGYGHADGKQGGDAVKELIGDALRNAAMRFGAALDLWHKGDLHGESEDAQQPAPMDEKASFEAAVSQAIRGIGREETMESLGALWGDLTKRQRAVAEDARVIKAKDAKKAELTPRRTDIDDEIPY